MDHEKNVGSKNQSIVVYPRVIPECLGLHKALLHAVIIHMRHSWSSLGSTEKRVFKNFIPLLSC